jgi:uncharacterized protein YjbI with pentapeptide repeats
MSEKRSLHTEEGHNLSRVVLKSADFTKASLRYTNFTGANLTDSTFTKALARVLSVTFSFISPNSKIVASGSLDETIKFWDIQSSECFKTLDNRPYTNTNITDIKGLNSA